MILNLAKRNRSCLLPTDVKFTVALRFGPFPSTLTTFPCPNCACSTVIPGSTSIISEGVTDSGLWGDEVIELIFLSFGLTGLKAGDGDAEAEGL